MSELIYQDEFQTTVLRRLLWLGISGGAAIVALTVGLLVLALRPKVPPYIIAVDHGKIVGYAQVFSGNTALDEAITEDKIREFVYDTRVISNNHEFELRNIDTVYSMARGQATKWLNANFRASPATDPVAMSHKGDWRTVDITRVLKEPTEGNYRVEWTETLYSHFGEPVSSSWEATLRVIIGPPDTRTDLNPIGLYVVALDIEEAQTEAQQ
jgi:type IV secretory pathway TrbF-like protein